MSSTAHPAHEPTVTPREAAILDLVCRGLDDKTIAARLALAHGSVRNRLTRLYRKLGVPGRTAAAFRWQARRTAISPAPPPAAPEPPPRPRRRKAP